MCRQELGFFDHKFNFLGTILFVPPSVKYLFKVQPHIKKIYFFVADLNDVKQTIFPVKMPECQIEVDVCCEVLFNRVFGPGLLHDLKCNLLMTYSA